MADESNADAAAESSSSALSNMSIGFKLTGKEVYTTWMFAMTTLLPAYGLADYVDKSKSATTRDPAKRAKAVLTSIHNVDFNQLSLIKSFADDPAGAWAALSAKYAG